MTSGSRNNPAACSMQGGNLYFYNSSENLNHVKSHFQGYQCGSSVEYANGPFICDFLVLRPEISELLQVEFNDTNYYMAAEGSGMAVQKWEIVEDEGGKAMRAYLQKLREQAKGQGEVESTTDIDLPRQS